MSKSKCQHSSSMACTFVYPENKEVAVCPDCCRLHWLETGEDVKDKSVIRRWIHSSDRNLQEAQNFNLWRLLDE